MEESSPSPENPRPADPEVKQVPFDEAQAINAEPHDGAEGVRSLTPWRPEDAAHFLTQTIRESQRPLSEALAQRGVPTSVVLVGLITMIFFAGGLMFLIVRLDRKSTQTGEGKPPAGLSAVEEARWQQQADENASRVEALEREVASLEERLVIAARERDRAVARADAVEDKIDEVAEAGAKRIAVLAEQLEQQDVLGARLADAEELYRKTIAGQATQRKASTLRQQQLSAQTQEVESLRKQLAAAQELIRVLQGGDVTPKKEAVVPEEKKEETKTAEKDAVVEKGEE
ncbi:MAG: hypothetical protein ACYTGH_04420 [Planctomycetota bacterium]|jgi:polyhydroxyalkanoate synthesis regulator phasin